MGLVSEDSASDQSEESNDGENDSGGNESSSFLGVLGQLLERACETLLDQGRLLSFEILDLPPVTLCGKSSGSLIEFGLESIEMMLLDWVNGGKNVPVNVFSTWWGRNRSLVDPSVFEISHFHDGSVRDNIDFWLRSSGCPLHGVEESINDSDLVFGHALVIVVDIEYEAHGGGNEVSTSISRSRLAIWYMDGVHLKIVSLSVDGVLGSSMHVELESIPGHSCAEHGGCQLRSEGVGAVDFGRERDLGGIRRSESGNLDGGIELVYIFLGKLIIF